MEDIRFLWDGYDLQQDINKKVMEVTELQIATAYYSTYGFELLNEWSKKWGLSKQHITLYLSQEFSMNQPGELLKKTMEIAEVYLVEDLFLHAKVYYFKGSNPYVCHGSSNLTRGGYESNAEFNSLQTVTEAMGTSLGTYFKQLHAYSEKVTEETVRHYDELESALAEWKEAKKKLTQSIRPKKMQQDPFDSETYELQDYYFQYEDFAVFFNRNMRLGSSHPIHKQRIRVKTKLLHIHSIIEKRMKKLNLHPHRHPNFILSSIIPNKSNRERVSWLGIRYGKSPNVLSSYNVKGVYWDKTKEADSMYQHANIQVGIRGEGVNVTIFHSIANGAMDREYFHKKLHHPEVEEVIVTCFNLLKGNGFEWRIYDPEANHVKKVFSIDKRDPKDFISFYENYDREGLESYFLCSFSPNDPRIKTAESIADTSFEIAKVLAPLYHIISETKGLGVTK
ncbi:hypothetical protein COK52_06810 [Bacillus thuringiensis]|nr:hypothetical protein COK52_06810 [Bacillus thuringiensis]